MAYWWMADWAVHVLRAFLSLATALSGWAVSRRRLPSSKWPATKEGCMAVAASRWNTASPYCGIGPNAMVHDKSSGRYDLDDDDGDDEGGDKGEERAEEDDSSGDAMAPAWILPKSMRWGLLRRRQFSSSMACRAVSLSSAGRLDFGGSGDDDDEEGDKDEEEKEKGGAVAWVPA